MTSQGYQPFPHLLDPALVGEVSTAVEDLCRSLRPGDERWEKHVFPLSKLKSHRNPGVSADANLEVPFLLSDLARLSPALEQLIRHPALWTAARDVLGTKDVVCHFSNVTRKPAFVGPNLSWHRDYPNEYVCPKRSADFFRLLIPLETMTEENGCTLAIPGSHHLTDEEALLEPKDIDLSQVQPLIMEAGSAVAIHSKLMHGGRENRSGQTRNLVVMQFGRPTTEFLHDLRIC